MQAYNYLLIDIEKLIIESLIMTYIGVDVIEISRIEKAILNRGERFLRRVYTEKEIASYGRNFSSLAARFAAKEAVIKALDAANRISFVTVEILNDKGGKPVVNLYGKASELAGKLGIAGFAISLSHSKDVAIAMVIGETA